MATCIADEQRCLEKELQSKLQALRSEVLEKGYAIPPLRCSFSFKRHPDSEQLREECIAWVLDRFSHLRGTFEKAVLQASTFYELVSLVYPLGLPSRMRPAFKFMAWLFMFDDLVDDTMGMGSDLLATNYLINRTCKVFAVEEKEEEKEERGCTNRQAVEVLVQTAGEWWREMTEAGMPRAQRLRMAEKVIDYMQAHHPLIESRGGASSSKADVEAYKQIRARVGGWHACSVVMEFVVGVELNEKALCHPLILSFQSAANDHICWVNDLTSLRKELMDNDPMNLVVVMYLYQHIRYVAAVKVDGIGNHAPSPTLQGVVDKIGEMIRECDAQCVSLKAQIEASTLQPDDKALHHYLEAVGYWLSGSLYWHLRSPRYAVPGGAS